MDFLKFWVTHNDHDVPHRIIYSALKQIKSEALSGQDIVEFSHVIGYSNLVEVDESDEFMKNLEAQDHILLGS